MADHTVLVAALRVFADTYNRILLVVDDQEFYDRGDQTDDDGGGSVSGSGRPVVVWAGVGRRVAGVGPAEMDAIRTKVADARAERLNADKLASIKPYSRHGF